MTSHRRQSDVICPLGSQYPSRHDVVSTSVWHHYVGSTSLLRHVPAGINNAVRTMYESIVKLYGIANIKLLKVPKKAILRWICHEIPKSDKPKFRWSCHKTPKSGNRNFGGAVSSLLKVTTQISSELSQTS